MLEPGGDIRSLLLQTAAQNFAVFRVLQERFLPADAFDVVANFQRAVIVAKGELFEFGAKGTGERAQIAGIILEVADGGEAGTVQNLFGNAAHAEKRAHRERAQERHFFRLGDEGKAIGLLMVTGNFGEQFVGGNANGRGELTFRPDRLFQLPGQRNGGAQGVIRRFRLTTDGQIQISLINGHRFDDGAGAGDDGHDLAGFFAVMVNARAHEDALGAKAAGGRAGQGGADAEFPRFIAGGADHAALGGRRAHDHRLAAQFRMITLFHGSVEGVHIEMENDPEHPAHSLAGALSCKQSEVANGTLIFSQAGRQTAPRNPAGGGNDGGFSIHLKTCQRGRESSPFWVMLSGLPQGRFGLKMGA